MVVTFVGENQKEAEATFGLIPANKDILSAPVVQSKTIFCYLLNSFAPGRWLRNLSHNLLS